ncbi:PAS domain-containing protein [Spirosoma knui]
MGQLTRQYDWTSTSLGTPDQWPQSLRTTLSILLNSRFPMFLFWGDELLCFYNDAYRPSLGNTGKHPWALGQPGAEVWPEVWPQIKPLIDQVLAGQGATWSEDQLLPIYRNGRLEDVFWTFSYSPVSDESGQPAGVFVTCNETTDKVLPLKQLRLSRQRFENLVREIPVGIVVVLGKEMRVSIVNEAFGRLVSRTVAELQDQPLFDIMPEAADPFQNIISTVRLSGEPVYLYDQPYIVYANGERQEGYLNLVYQPYKEVDETITGVMVVCQDVSLQVLARKKIEQSEAKFRTLIEEAPVATCLFVGPQMRIDLANDTMINYFGKGPSIHGKPIREVLTEPKDQQAIDLLDQVFSSGQAFEAKSAPADLTINNVAGTYYFDFSLKPLLNADGEVYAIIEMAIDVTEQVRAWQQLEESEARYRNASTELEQQVQQRTAELASLNEELAAINEELMATNEELASANREYVTINEELAATTQELTESNALLLRSNENLQRFAYVASHDLQEPLRKIQQFGDLLKTRYEVSSGDEIDYLERMQSAARRMSVLIRDLLTFSRISTQREAGDLVPLNQVVNSVLTDLDLIIEETGANVLIDPLPTIVGDASQLGQLFSNLLSNALKFRRAGVPPVIQIRAGVITADQLPPAIKPGRGATLYHRIEVADNGIGFEEKYLDRMFQVFQRLHGRSEYAGTGIGLAICEKVVTNHGGAITAISQPGQGATFHIYLPA